MIGRFAVRDRVVSWVDRAIDVQDDAIRTYLSQVDGSVDTGDALDVADGNGLVPDPSAVSTAQIPLPTGKYAGRHSLLTSVRDDEVTLSLTAVNASITGGLPAAARRNSAWWGNDPTSRAPQTKARLTADTVRLRRGSVPVDAAPSGTRP